MFANSRNFAITGGEFTHINYVQSVFDKLKNATAPSALYDSSARYDPPRCHPNTRVAVLEYLIGWIFGRNDPKALILWLYGPAGAGKSAILQTIAEWCAKNNTLLASFFFSHSDPTRNRITPLIPTIACQIAITIPEIKPYIEGAIERDPFLLDKSPATQFQHLIVTPLQALAASGNLKSGFPRLIVIDGLDECDDPKMQNMILKVIADAFHSRKLSLIFLIASRPEQNIMYTFSSSTLSGLWRSVVLDDTYKPDDDIHLFLMDSFHEIKTTHPHCHLIPETWPSDSDVYALIRKSSGQFIYASQIVKYISDPNDRPSRRLDVIMGLRPAQHDLPFAELDALYAHLLEGCLHNLNIVLEILGLHLIGIMDESFIEIILDMEPGDVAIRLAPLTSIVRVKRRTITLLHASFKEFITDPSRAPPNCYINLLAVKERGLSRIISCLHLHTTPFSTTNQYSYSPSLGYNFGNILHSDNSSLSKNIEGVLLDVSLLDFWMSASTQNWVDGGFKCKVIYHFLNSFNRNHFYRTKGPAEELEALEKIYNFHKASFAPTIKLELSKYLKNPELKMVLILSTYQYSPFSKGYALYLSSETISMDKQSLGIGASLDARSLILEHYKELLPVFNPSDYVPTALQILAFLCAKHPHYTQYYEPSQMAKSTPPIRIQSAFHHPTHGLKKKFYVLTSHATYHTRRHSVPYSRFRRQEKHCHGICLIRETGFKYEAALGILPLILEKCSKSEELITFICKHRSKIIYFPKATFYPRKNPTRNAIRAMHAYLDRVSQDVEIVDTEYPTL